MASSHFSTLNKNIKVGAIPVELRERDQWLLLRVFDDENGFPNERLYHPNGEEVILV